MCIYWGCIWGDHYYGKPRQCRLRWREYKLACLVSLRNQLFCLYPSLVILFLWYPFTTKSRVVQRSACTATAFITKIPEVWWVMGAAICNIGYFVFQTLIADIFCCVNHNVAYTRKWWPYHNAHYRYPIPIAVLLDATFLEQFMATLVAVSVGPLMMVVMGYHMNIYAFMSWIGFMTIRNCVGQWNAAIAAYGVRGRALHLFYGVSWIRATRRVKGDGGDGSGKKVSMYCPICLSDHPPIYMNILECAHAVCWKCTCLGYETNKPLKKCPICRHQF